MGDLNDSPGPQSSLSPLLDCGFLENVVQRLPEHARWTHFFQHPTRPLESTYKQLDYILLSPSLTQANPTTKPVISRAGLELAATGFIGNRYFSPTGGFRASDHCPLHMDLVLSLHGNHVSQHHSILKTALTSTTLALLTNQFKYVVYKDRIPEWLPSLTYKPDCSNLNHEQKLILQNYFLRLENRANVDASVDEARKEVDLSNDPPVGSTDGADNDIEMIKTPTSHWINHLPFEFLKTQNGTKQGEGDLTEDKEPHFDEVNFQALKTSTLPQNTSNNNTIFSLEVLPPVSIDTKQLKNEFNALREKVSPKNTLDNTGDFSDVYIDCDSDNDESNTPYSPSTLSSPHQILTYPKIDPNKTSEPYSPGFSRTLTNSLTNKRFALLPPSLTAASFGADDIVELLSSDDDDNAPYLPTMLKHFSKKEPIEDKIEVNNSNEYPGDKLSPQANTLSSSGHNHVLVLSSDDESDDGDGGDDNNRRGGNSSRKNDQHNYPQGGQNAKTRSEDVLSVNTQSGQHQSGEQYHTYHDDNDDQDDVYVPTTILPSLLSPHSERCNAQNNEGRKSDQNHGESHKKQDQVVNSPPKSSNNNNNNNNNHNNNNNQRGNRYERLAAANKNNSNLSNSNPTNHNEKGNYESEGPLLKRPRLLDGGGSNNKDCQEFVKLPQKK
jgi:hypothetical protein